MSLTKFQRELLEAVSLSKNEICSTKAKRILSGEVNPNEERALSGGFMKAIIDGDLEAAYERADFHNRQALKEIYEREAKRYKALIPFVARVKGIQQEFVAVVDKSGALLGDLYFNPSEFDELLDLLQAMKSGVDYVQSGGDPLLFDRVKRVQYLINGKPYASQK